MNYNVLFSCISHVGNCRSMNQDNFICDGQYLSNKDEDIVFPLIGNVSSRKKSIFGIFDGMGGEEAGEMASDTGSDGQKGACQSCGVPRQWQSPCPV